MSKITFRADDELIQELEAFDASKSEVMRRALRSYVDDHEGSDGDVAAAEDADDGDPVGDDESIEERVVELVDERVAQLLGERPGGREPARRRAGPPQDINVNIELDGDAAASADPDADDARKTRVEEAEEASDGGRSTCPQCGESVGSEDVYCPNCGTKSSHRVFCECGDELRSDWGFCPGCGRRTPAADVLDGP